MAGASSATDGSPDKALASVWDFGKNPNMGPTPYETEAEAAPSRAGRKAGAWGRLAEGGAGLLSAMLGLWLLWAGLASLAVPLGRYARKGSLEWLGGAGLYLAVFGLLAWGVKKTARWAEWRVAGGLIVLAALVRLALAGWAADLPLQSDQALFHTFVSRMVDSGGAPEVMESLSGIYDYPLWTGRGLPFHWLARRWLGAGDVRAMRLANVGVSVLLLLGTAGLAWRLLPAGRRKWAVLALAALPFQTVVTTDYSHHLFASLYVLVCIWSAWELLFTDAGGWRRAGWALAAGVALMLLVWQRGTHLIVLATWGRMRRAAMAGSSTVGT